MIITSNNVHRVFNQRVLEIPFKGVDKKGIIESIETCRKHFDTRKTDDKVIFIPGPPIDGSEDNLELLEQKDNGHTYIKRDKTGVVLSSDIFMDSATRELFHAVHNHIVNLHKSIVNEEVECAYQNSWFFISTKETELSQYHDHVGFKLNYPNAVTNYTWTYYVQKPNNCEGIEGKLSFSTDKNESEIEMMEVKEDTLYIFPPSLLHRPNLSPNSTKDRITAAGNICIPNSDKCFLL